MSTQSLGTFRWAHRESVLFARRFSAWAVVILVFSLPAVAVTAVVSPDALIFLLAGMLALVTSLTGNGFEQPDSDEELNMSFREALTFIVVMYTMFAGGFSLILLSGVVIGLLVGSAISSPSTALLIALVFPILDRTAERHLGYSLFGLTTLCILAVFELLTTVYRLSGSVKEQARRGRRRMIN